MPEPAKVWVAFYDDFSELAVFTDELECLRWAVDRTVSVAQVEYGRGIVEQIREQWQARLAERPPDA